MKWGLVLLALGLTLARPPLGAASDNPRAAAMSRLPARQSADDAALPPRARTTAHRGRLSPPPANWLLERAHRAAGHVPYSGRQVTVLWHRRETTATVTQEYHTGDGRLRIETLMPFRTRGRVVVYDGRDRWQYEPSRHVVYRCPASAVSPGPSVDQLLKQYVAVVAPRPERVARRRVWRVELTPRLAGKVVRWMWIDPETGLVLRYVRTTARGRPLSVSHFSHIRLGVPPARLFQRPGPAHMRIVLSQPTPVPLSLAEARARFGVPLPVALPAGYTFADATLLPGKGRPVGHLRYRDGLSAVSLYVGPPGALPYDIRRGKTLALRGGAGRLQSVQHFYVLSWHSPHADFALVGDASPELLRTLANGTALTAGAKSAPPGGSAPRWLLGLAVVLFGLSGAGIAHRRRSRRHSEDARRQLRISTGSFP
jgi:outer membrane lipoprotein-sorting protein